MTIAKTYTDNDTLYASDMNTIVSEINTLDGEIGNKVDKIDGKGLSTNDFTNDDKTKLDSVSNGANKTSSSSKNGYIKINDNDITVYTHPSVNLVNDGVYGTLNGTTDKFPAIGTIGKIYIDNGTKLHYIWDGTTYTLTNTNPHGTTKEDVGLSNVDNTKDIDKPISTLTQNALTDLSNKITILKGADTTANRPTPTYIGQIYFDTTLGKPIWCKDITTPIWVDSTGTTV